ncbi:MAG: 4Fe-4S binding protein [Muribaculaceae bacterium]|nr:4Fe-4S binding protein [Muribaculaceae bacterium]
MKEKSTIYRQEQGKPNGAGTAMRLGRRVTAIVAISVMTVYFVMLGTSAALKLKWIANIQIVPVISSVSASLLVMWLLVTLVFGRVYCSMVCPLGIVQDLFARLPRISRRQQSRHPYSFHGANNRFRYVWLAVIIGSVIAGTSMLLALFDPYTAFSRFMTYLLRPLIAAASGKTVVAGTLAGTGIAIVTFVAVAVVAIRRGRFICNTVCPVGSILSIVSRHSVYRMDINTDTCINCGRCEQVCKAECIDYKQHTVDMSRCVVCFNCTAECENGAITYTSRRHQLSIPMLMKPPRQRAAASMEIPPASADQLNTSTHINEKPDR